MPTLLGLLIKFPLRTPIDMKKTLYIPLALLIAGSILSVVGANSYINESGTALCTACGMKISKSDTSTLAVSSTNGQIRYACCPVCAGMVGLYVKNATITGECIGCGKEITFQLANGALSSSNPAVATMISGGSCAKNKLACSAACEATIRSKNDWAANAPVKTSSQVIAAAQTKLASVTISDKPDSISTPVYALLGSGIALLAFAPVTWVYLKKSRT